jgi:hypothetical protein
MASTAPPRPPPPLRTSTTLSAEVKEAEDDNDRKDDYGDLYVNSGEPQEQDKGERERIRYLPASLFLV